MTEPEQRSSSRKWLLRAAKLAILVVVLWFVRRSFAGAWSQLQSQELSFRWGWIGLSVVLYTLGLFPCGVFWYQSLRALGQRPTFFRAIRAYYIGHLGKYVPGKAMVVILRAGLVRGPEVKASAAAVCVFLETLTYLAVGAFWAAGYMAIYLQEQTVYLIGAVLMMIVAGLPTLPPIFVRLARLARVGKSDPETAAELDRLGMKTLGSGWGLMTLGWFIQGVCYWTILKGLGVDTTNLLGELPCCTACVSLATVIGFVVLVAPGGLLVREAALASLTGPYLAGLTVSPELVAWSSAAVLRLVSLAAESTVALVLYLAGLRTVGKNRETAGPSSPQSEPSQNAGD
jgi:uncharacterized membrane protein YbhN (UPF0104 family)